MELPRLSSPTAGTAVPKTLQKQESQPSASPGQSDEFQPNPDKDPAPKKPRGGKVFATVSLTGSAGMFVGAKIGASLGNPAMGFLIGTLVGGGVGLALAQFAYPPS